MSAVTLYDQMGREVHAPFPPKRIVSLVPSQTELLFDLGLDSEIVGLTKFCVHPDENVKRKTRIGGTKSLLLDKIRELKPDLIIGNKEENERSQIEELMRDFPVWMSDIETVADAVDMIRSVGAITGRAGEAQAIVEGIQNGFEKLSSTGTPLRVAYLIWRDPYMAAGNHTFIQEILQLGGWQNAITESRYPQISAEELRKVDPDLIFLSSEPYPFKEKHVPEFTTICPNALVKVVDGELFSWYGSRLQHAPEYLFSLQLTVNQQYGNIC